MERVSDRAELAELMSVATEHGWRVNRIFLASVRTAAGFLEAWHAARPFSDMFGWNWDAFADTAFEDPGSPALIVLEGWESFADASPDDWHILMEIIGERAPEAGFRVVLG